MKEVQGALGFDEDQIIALCGKTMYSGEIPDIAVKELTQNGFDAIKIALHLGMIKRGKLDINVDTCKRTISVKDNGIGMTTDILLKAFFTIGGSYKGEDSDVSNKLKSGGLGMAKVAFLFSSEWIEVTTIHNGQKAYFHVTPQEIKKGFSISVTDTDEPNGSEVTVKIPEVYIDSNGEEQFVYMNSRPSFLRRPMIGDVDVTFNSETDSKDCLPGQWLPLGTAKANFGDLDIYVRPDSGRSISYDVLCSGLYQFTKNIWPDGKKMGIKVIVNILPSVGVKSALYPINNQREGFRSTCKEVDDLKRLFEDIQTAYTNGKYAAALDNCISMDVRELSSEKRIPFDGEILKGAVEEVKGILSVSTPEDFANVLKIVHEIRKQCASGYSSLDTSGVMIPKTSMINTSGFDIAKPIFHNNTTMMLEEDAVAFLKEFGAMLLEVKSLYLQTYETASRKVGCWGEEVLPGVRMSDQYWGISFDKNYLGVNVAPKVFNFIGINPFGHTLPAYKGVNPAVIITEEIIHTIIHEVNHNYAPEEGSTFTSNLVVTEAEFSGIGALYEQWRQKLYALVVNNLPLIVEYHKRYKSSSNKGESLNS